MEKITDVACVKNEIYKDSIYNLSKILLYKVVKEKEYSSFLNR